MITAIILFYLGVGEGVDITFKVKSVPVRINVAWIGFIPILNIIVLVLFLYDFFANGGLNSGSGKSLSGC